MNGHGIGSRTIRVTGPLRRSRRCGRILPPRAIDRKNSSSSGMVQNTLPRTSPETIALLRLDTDWYESTVCVLNHLYPNLSDGGVLIVDDYGHMRGRRKAVDEYFSSRNEVVFFNRVDYSGRVAIKLPRMAGGPSERPTFRRIRIHTSAKANSTGWILRESRQDSDGSANQTVTIDFPPFRMIRDHCYSTPRFWRIASFGQQSQDA